MDIECLEENIQYCFKDKDLLIKALSHRSASESHNERLEFLGDAALSVIIAALLYEAFPSASEGTLTRFRSHLVNKHTLCRLGKRFELGRYILLGEGEKRNGGAGRASILADTLEALIAAIYLDSSFEEVQTVLNKWFNPLLDQLSLSDEGKDPKTKLQEWLQANRYPLPTYVIESVRGRAHEQEFWVRCEVECLDKQTRGNGLSRRIAEQGAAEKALELLGVHE